MRKRLLNKSLSALLVALIYAVIAVLWIVFSSEAAGMLISNINDLKNAEIYKGLLFVLVTSVILFYALRIRDKKYDMLNEEITRANKEWRNMFDSANDPMIIVNEKNIIQESNNQAKKLFNKELTGAGFDSIGIKKPAGFNNLILNGNDPVSGFIDESAYIENGKIIPLEISFKNILWKEKNCLLYLIKDISERKDYEAKLSESGKKYRSLVESSQDLIWSLDHELRITFINIASVNIFGIEPEKMIGRKFSEFMEPEYAEKESDTYRKAAAEGQNIINYENMVRGAGNKSRHLIISAVLNRDNNGNITSISGSSHDITERAGLEKKIENITNLYAALTSINELLLRAKDEESILSDSCKLTVENGKFKMAWIGIVNKNTGRIEPAYFFGKNDNYVKSLDININEPAGARGPIVRALLEKIHYISNDIENDLFISRWKDAAIESGFRSFAVFPIEVGDKVIGTLNIYDDKKNRFSNEITQLLLHLMEDITFALERFELEKQRSHYENLFHKIVDRATISVIMEDHGDVIYANSAAINMFGAASMEELAGKPLAELVADNYRNEVKALLERVYSGERAEENEVVMIKTDGTEMYTVCSVIPFQVNERTGSLSFIRDITSEKSALDALQSSEEKWRSLFENTPSFVTTINRKFVITSANRAPLPLRTEEIIGHSALEYVDSKMKAEVRKLYEFVFESGEPSVYHTSGYGEYGRGAFFRVQAIPQMKNGIVNQLTLIASDITETKRASDALRESQMRLNSIVDSALDAIITVDSSFKIILFNKTAERIFNCPFENAIGTSMTRFIPALAKFIKDQRISKLELQPDISEFLGKGKVTFGVRLTGERFPAEASVSESTVEKNFFYTFILRDISERLKAENELMNSYQQVRDLAAHLQSAREEERINIAREIHDELGQELSALKMDISFLNKKIAKTREAPDWDAITENLRSMTSIADQTIKTVRKISSQLRPDVLDKLGLNDALEWLAEDFTRRTGIKCTVEVKEMQAEFNKNIQTVIYRICQESLTNIMRHANATKVQIRVNETGDKLVLEINDNGKGITAEEINNGRSLGIVGMKERAYFVGGTFEISGARGNGTKTQVIIPIHK